MPQPVNTLGRNRFLKYGLPFVGLLVGGSFGLQQFAQLRYTFKKGKTITNEEAQAMGISMKSEKPTLESEYESMKTKQWDTWENIRGPRPWEDSKTVQDEQREQLGLPTSQKQNTAPT